MNKITKEFLESQIDDIKYTQMNDRLTHCLITTKSGFLFSGESVVIDPSNFDKELGEKYAYEEAFNSMWEPYGFWLHGQLTKEKLGVARTEEWFEKVFPTPTIKNVAVQIGVHFEEVAEMLDALGLPSQELHTTALDLKEGNYTDFLENQLANENVRHQVLDALGDQQVTLVGSAHTMGMNLLGALDEINKSNFTKFDENENPIYNEFGKVAKSERYVPPNLTPFIYK